MQPAIPRLSTTVLLIRDRSGLEVLMVERHEGAYFGSALVFPGGIVDEEDRSPKWLGLATGGEDLSDEERAIRIAGYRELHEETGLLLAAGVATEVKPSTEAGFFAQVKAMAAPIDLAAMHPFAHWITPEMSPKRYDTHFRLCGLTTEVVAVSDGRETVSADWLRPADALELGRSGERKVLFPTRLNLELLAQASSVDAAIEAARGRPVVTVSPRVERRPEGIYLTIRHDAGYGPAQEFTPVRPNS